MNPHVRAALGDWGKLHQMQAFLPRQQATAASSLTQLMAGTSSMGMSGVNAHMLLSCTNEIKTSPDSLVRRPAQFSLRLWYLVFLDILELLGAFAM